jgi:hypothetical protein
MKKTFAVMTDDTFGLEYGLWTGDFLDSECDFLDADGISKLVADGHAEYEKPQWFYYSFAKNQAPRFFSIDTDSREDAIAKGRTLYETESEYRKAHMFECGVVLCVEGANMFTESGRGIEDVERFVLDW